MFGPLSERSMQNVGTSGIGNDAFGESSLTQRLRTSNSFMSQSFTAGRTKNGTAPLKYPRTMNYETRTACVVLPAAAVSGCMKPRPQTNDMMVQPSAQGPSQFSAISSSASSCALSRWIAMQSYANNPAAGFADTTSAISDPPPTSTPAVIIQFSSQQEDTEPLPLTSNPLRNAKTSVHQLGSNVSNGATMMNMIDLLLEGGQQQQFVSMAANPCLTASASAHLVSDNDLDSYGTEEPVVVGNKSARFRRDQAEQWSERYDELVMFLKEHGHCRVPRNHKKYRELYVLFKTMTLKTLCVCVCLCVWYRRSPASLTLLFTCFCYLPSARSSWVKRQRYQYKLRQEGKTSFLTDERIAVLDQLGFIWDSHSSIWEIRFQELQEFRVHFGHTNVPYNYKNAKLASWIKAQRREMRAFKEGKVVSPEMFQRFLELEKLDFCWQIRHSGRKKQSKEARDRLAIA
jgi:hypothetical protein